MTSPAADMPFFQDEIRLASRALGGGLYQTDIAIPGVRCAGCIRTVESGLLAMPGVEYARVNLSTKRAGVRWRGEGTPALLETLEKLGFPGHIFRAEETRKDPELGRLIRALAVAGFSAMNIMLLSVSVWSGADAATRHAFHWISASLALLCLLYSGRIFFLSAWSALKRGRTNMDVPISIGVSLAFGLSLYDTINNGPHAYFDAATSLIFFLLIGRTLDRLMCEKARAAVEGLIQLAPRGATVLQSDGSRKYIPVAEIEPGMQLLLVAGDRVPVDATVKDGRSELDRAIATGESMPQPVQTGSKIQAGTLNLTGALTVIATARAEDSFLAEMLRLMAAAEDGRARYRRLADRAASLYSPLVHTAALLTFCGWMLATGDVHRSVTIAIAALIITCPCALGLAVPIVQVVATRRLFENGIMVKDGSGIERLAEIDSAVFDKTGTLTSGDMRLANEGDLDPEALAIAGTLGAHSKHPHSQALAALVDGGGFKKPPVTDVREEAGLGVEGRIASKLYRLGRADWALSPGLNGPTATGTVLASEGTSLAVFHFKELLRPGASDTIALLRAAGIPIEILSGDNAPAVATIAASLTIDHYASGLLPGQKVERLTALAAAGRKTLMVGDGLNDAPALAAAHVSMAPVTAADIGRQAADFVFLRPGLEAVATAHAVATEAGKLVRQNFGLAILYNVIALPIAILGHVTPLIAALAMSSSSIIVVANALRLKAGKQRLRRDADFAPAMSAPTINWKR
ncbi:heavy metal translocating P-type ATPase [Govanella unica]|uniref:Heavy metal translocating P-type ATPase n=1 Tax=Govanella unica TaxID=2975056 RepID=A0A9X3TZ81_9PROT|nr:heavy metal translocating P-type ATPase [Govania unica]MDA5194455.1 heavy metal translocating P-type ATPase [Govania unica]